MAKLSERDKRFAEEYLIDLNATQAAIRAGYARATAEGACKWITESNPEKPMLRARIDAELAERSKRTGVTQDRVVRELARIAFADMTDMADRERAKIKACDKLKALELLGKHLGMYADKVILTDDRPTIVDNIPGGEADG